MGSGLPPSQRHERMLGCDWVDPSGRHCQRMLEHPDDRENPNHRVRLTVRREYDLVTGQLVLEVDE